MRIEEGWTVFSDEDPFVRGLLKNNYTEAIESPHEVIEEGYLHRRAARLRRLALDPQNPLHWKLESMTLSEIERRAESMRWLGHPDGDWGQVKLTEAYYNLFQTMTEISGTDHMGDFNPEV